MGWAWACTQKYSTRANFSPYFSGNQNNNLFVKLRRIPCTCHHPLFSFGHGVDGRLPEGPAHPKQGELHPPATGHRRHPQAGLRGGAGQAGGFSSGQAQGRHLRPHQGLPARAGERHIVNRLCIVLLTPSYFSGDRDREDQHPAPLPSPAVGQEDGGGLGGGGQEAARVGEPLVIVVLPAAS